MRKSNYYEFDLVQGATFPVYQLATANLTCVGQVVSNCLFLTLKFWVRNKKHQLSEEKEMPHYSVESSSIKTADRKARNSTLKGGR